MRSVKAGLHNSIHQSLIGYPSALPPVRFKPIKPFPSSQCRVLVLPFRAEVSVTLHWTSPSRGWMFGCLFLSFNRLTLRVGGCRLGALAVLSVFSAAVGVEGLGSCGFVFLAVCGVGARRNALLFLQPQVPRLHRQSYGQQHTAYVQTKIPRPAETAG